MVDFSRCSAGLKLSVPCFLAFLLILAASARAEVRPVAHYRIGDSGGGIALTPLADAVKNRAGAGNLAKIGMPMFVTSAPDLPSAKGKGSALFNGKADGFVLCDKILAEPSDFVFEAWVLSSRANAPGIHTAAALGNGGGRL